MVKIIKVTGKSFCPPPGAEALMEKGRDVYESLAFSITGDKDYSKLGDKYHGNLELADKILIKGPSARYMRVGYSVLASYVADSIREPLELILNDKKPIRLGQELERGTIIARGQAGRETGWGMRGGLLYIDGDVQQIEGPDLGIIYVNGNLKELQGKPSGCLIVAGEIGRYKDKYGHEDEIWKRKPFVFARDCIPYRLQDKTGETPVGYLYGNLKDWEPENVKARALALCANIALKDMDKITSEITNYTNLLVPKIDEFLAVFKRSWDVVESLK